MLFVGAEKNQTVNGGLTFIWERANQIFNDKFGIKIKSLHCPFCGESVEDLKKEQDTHICRYCGTKFKKSELKRF